MVSQERPSFLEGQLTCFALFDLLCCDGKNSKYLDHGFYHNVHQSCSWRNLDINFKSSKEVFDALEEVNKYVLVGTNSLSCLKEKLGLMIASAKKRRTLTERRMSIPVKMTAAGGYVCQNKHQGDDCGQVSSRPTRPTPPPMAELAEEKAQNTFTVELSNVVDLSLLLRA